MDDNMSDSVIKPTEDKVENSKSHDSDGGCSSNKRDGKGKKCHFVDESLSLFVNRFSKSYQLIYMDYYHDKL
jgi:hypothetical protein